MSTAAKHAYVVYGRTFITCDTPATLKMKIDAAAALGLGGLMVRGRQTCAETLQTDVHSPRTHLHKKNAHSVLYDRARKWSPRLSAALL